MTGHGPTIKKDPSGPKLKDVLRTLNKIEHRSKANGNWPFERQELIRELLKGDKSLNDTGLQAILLDWMESADYNEFISTETGEKIYALSSKRGNVVYATRKTKNRDRIKNCLDGKVFDFPIPGFRNRRRTRLLFVTINFDRNEVTPEEAWASARSTPVDGMDYEYNVLNRLNANFRKIFGPHGTLISKEAQSSAYPSPHIILLLDEPVTVERHVGKDGKISWRLVEERILNRIGKGPLMRKLSRSDYRKAIKMNPIWKYGFIDFEGIVKEERGRSGRDTVTYAFKYIVKCLTDGSSNSISCIKDINSVKSPKLRTMLFTHLGNKCFGTRDISFGKGFKDRIGLLPEGKKEGGSEWKRIRTMADYEYNFVSAVREQKSIQRFRDIIAEQNAGGRDVALSVQ